MRSIEKVSLNFDPAFLLSRSITRDEIGKNGGSILEEGDGMTRMRLLPRFLTKFASPTVRIRSTSLARFGIKSQFPWRISPFPSSCSIFRRPTHLCRLSLPLLRDRAGLSLRVSFDETATGMGNGEKKQASSTLLSRVHRIDSRQTGSIDSSEPTANFLFEVTFGYGNDGHFLDVVPRG